MPTAPTLLRRAATVHGWADRLPSYNSINNALKALTGDLRGPLTPSQSRIARLVLAPLARDGAPQALHAAITGAEPGSLLGLLHLVSARLLGERLAGDDDTPATAHLLGVQRQLAIEDGRLGRGHPIRDTVHARRLLDAHDPALAHAESAVARRRLRQLDTALYLIAAAQAEWGRALAALNHDEHLLDRVFRAPWSPRALANRFFEVLRDHAGLATWDALSLDGTRRELGANHTGHEQLVKWRNGSRRMSLSSLERLIVHSPGFDPARRELDLAVFADGYRLVSGVLGAGALLDDVATGLDPDPRSMLLERHVLYLAHHRGDLDAAEASGPSTE